MSKVRVSKSAASKVISFTEEAYNALIANIRAMDGRVNSQFAGMVDPALKRYAVLSEKLQNNLRQIGTNMEAISKYCKAVIRWIDDYGQI